MLLFYINMVRCSHEINVKIHATECMPSFETFCFPPKLLYDVFKVPMPGAKLTFVD